ncbi:MAG TPA: MmcQ/YjbR family DNA-binding protein [Candidatus Dormibacteraeota bacterium]
MDQDEDTQIDHESTEPLGFTIPRPSSAQMCAIEPLLADHFGRGSLTPVSGLRRQRHAVGHQMSVTIAQARRVAMSLPEVTEQPHHEVISFRVGGKIIATVPDGEHLRVMLDQAEIRVAASENPQSFHEFYWGRRLACLVIDLADVTVPQIRELLTEAWLRKASPELARRLRPDP